MLIPTMSAIIFVPETRYWQGVFKGRANIDFEEQFQRPALADIFHSLETFFAIQFISFQKTSFFVATGFWKMFCCSLDAESSFSYSGYAIVPVWEHSCSPISFSWYRDYHPNKELKHFSWLLSNVFSSQHSSNGVLLFIISCFM